MRKKSFSLGDLCCLKSKFLYSPSQMSLHCVSKNVPRVVDCNSVKSLLIFIFFIARKRMKFATKTYSVFHHTLIMLLHYLDKSKV